MGRQVYPSSVALPTSIMCSCLGHFGVQLFVGLAPNGNYRTLRRPFSLAADGKLRIQVNKEDGHG